MFKLLLIVVAVVAVVWLLRRALSGPHPRGGAPAPGAGDQQGDLIACAHCNVNLPRSEARGEGGRFYCSEEHWRLGPRDG